MAGQTARPLIAPWWGELRYAGELLRLLSREGLPRPRLARDGHPLLLIPGFMAGDSSLGVLKRWLERRGHRVALSGMRANVQCAERVLNRMGPALQDFAAETGRPAFLIGQSRGGAIARCLAVRHPDATAGLVMLGSPVCAPLAVSAPVLSTVRVVARLGDLGLPGVFSSSCRDGDCCAQVRDELDAPLAPHIRALTVYSRSDGVVDWRACLDPHAEPVEVDSSHCGMSIHTEVYELLARALDGRPAVARSRPRTGRARPRAVSSAAEAIG